VIWIGFACNALSAAAIYLSILMQPAPFWTLAHFSSPEKSQDAYAAIFGFIRDCWSRPLSPILPESFSMPL